VVADKLLLKLPIEINKTSHFKDTQETFLKQMVSCFLLYQLVSMDVAP
jgi:hypothetical protein